jgi:hypothetical protein
MKKNRPLQNAYAGTVLESIVLSGPLVIDTIAYHTSQTFFAHVT